MQTNRLFTRAILVSLIATLLSVGCGKESPIEVEKQARSNVTLAKIAPATETFSDHIGETLLDGNLGQWQLHPIASSLCILGFRVGPKLAIDAGTRTVFIINAQSSSGPVQLEDDTWFYLRLTHSIRNNWIDARVADSWGATNEHNQGIVTFIQGRTNNIVFDEFGPHPFILGGGAGTGEAPTVETGGILDCGDTQYIGTFWPHLAQGAASQRELPGTQLNFKFKILQATQKVKIAHVQWFIGEDEGQVY